MSNTVDNRVVEMKFDNQQFEAGVKQTIASLNSLEQALKINTDATNLRTFQNEVNNLRFNSIEENLQRLSDTFTGVGRIGTRIFDELIEKALRLSSTIANVSIGQILTGGKNRALKVADARFKLNGLLETAEDVEKAFTSAKNAVDGTAYGMDEAVSVAARLASSQVALGDDMDQALSGIAGLAAMTNTSFEYMGDIFATVAGNGRLMGDQLRQISGNGVNAAAILAKSMGKTEAEVRDLTSKGKIDFATFSKAMSDAFGEQAAKADKTFTGVLTNIKAQLSRIGEVFYGGIIENDELIAFLGEVKALIKSIVVLVQPLGEPFKKLITSIAHLGSAILKTFDVSGAENFVEKIAAAFEKISNFIDSLTEKVNGFTKTFKLDKVTDNVKNAVEKLRTITEAEKTIAQDIWKGRGNWGNGKERKDKLGDKYRDVQDYVNSLKEANFDLAKADEIYSKKVIKDSDDVVQAKERERQARERSFNTVNKHSKEKKNVEEYTGVVQILSNIFLSLKNIIVSISEAAKDTFSLNDIVGAIKSFVKFLGNLSERFKITDERAEKIKNTFKGLFSFIDIVARLVYNLGKILAAILVPAFEKVGDAFLTVTSFIGKYISAFNKLLKKHNVFGKISKTIIDILAKAKAYISAFIESVRNHTVFSDFVNVIKDIASAIKDKIIPSAKDAKDTVGDFNKTVKKVDTRWITKVVDKIAKIFEKLTDKLKKSKDKIVNTISGVINTFKNLVTPKKAVEDLAETSAEAGKETEEAVDKVVSPFTMIFDLASKVFDKTKELLKDFVDYAIEKIKELTPQQIGILMVSTAITTFFFSIAGVARHASKFIDKFAGIGTAVINTINAIKNNIDEFNKDKKRAYNLAIFQTFAAVLAIMAIALYKLSEIDTSKLIITAGVLAALMAVVMSFTREISNFGKGIEDLTQQQMMAAYIKDAAKLILALAASVLILSLAFKNIDKINTEGIWIKLAAFTVVFAEMIGAMFLLSKYAPTLVQGTSSLVALSSSILLMSISLALLSKMNTTDVIKASIAIAISLVALGGALALAGINAEKVRMGPLIMMIFALTAISSSLFALTLVQKSGGNIIAAAITIATIMATLVIAFGFMKKLTTDASPAKDYKAVTIIGVLANSLFMLALAVKNLAEINDYQKLAVSVSSLLVIMYVVLNLMVTVSNIPSIPYSTVAALGTMIIMLIAIAASLRVLLGSGSDWKTLLASAGAMGLVLLSVAASMSILSGVAATGAGALGMLVAMAAIFVVLMTLSFTMRSFATSLQIFTDAISQLLALDFSNFGTALKVLAAFGLTMSLLGVLLIPAGVGLVIFSTGLLVLSAALAVIGSVLTKTLKGLTTFITAITLLGSNGSKISKGLNTVSKTINTVIVEILRGIATGLIEGARVIAVNGLAIAMSVKAICASVLSIIGTILESLITLVVDAIILLLSKIDEKLPHILTSITGIVTKVLQFLADNVEVFAYYGTYIIVGLITGILNGIEAQLPDIADAVANISLTAINAFVDSLYKNQDAIRDALRGFIDIMALTVLNLLDELFGGLLSSNKIFGKYYKGILDELGAEVEEIQQRNAERRAEKEDEAYLKKKEQNKPKIKTAVNGMVNDITDQTDAAESGAETTMKAWRDKLQDSMSDYSISGMPSDVTEQLFTIDTTDIDTSSAVEAGTYLPEAAAEGVEENKEILNASFEGMYSKQVEEMKKAGWHEEVTDEGKVLVRDLNTGVEEETKDGGLDTGINKVTGKFTDAIDTLAGIGDDGGSNWISGLIKGMKNPDKLSELETATNEATDVVKNSTQTGLEEESPSKLSNLFGGYWIEGLANGLDDNHDMLKRSANKISDVLVTSMTAAVSSASDVVNDGMSISPVITPVVDSSNLNNVNAVIDNLKNPTTFKMAADSQLSIDNANQFRLGQQIDALRADINKMANTDFSKIMDGVTIDVSADTTVDGTVLRKTASSYTIGQINKKQQGYIMATGGRF